MSIYIYLHTHTTLSFPFFLPFSLTHIQFGALIASIAVGPIADNYNPQVIFLFVYMNMN